MSALVVRPARDADLEDLAEIHASAYPEPGGIDHHARCLTHNAFGGLERLRVAEKNGRPVGHAALYMLEIWLGGRRVPVGGIGSLAVAPEARRQGVARAMLDALEAEIASEGGALALLYPFAQSFYARRGYAALSPLLTLEVAIDAVAALPAVGAGEFSTIRLAGNWVREARALYEAVGESSAGRVVRSESRWMKLFAREHWHWMGVVSQEGRLAGYVSFSYEGRPLGRDQTLVVHELTARDAPAARALLRACGNQRDQVARLEITIPYGDPLALAFEDGAGSRRAKNDTHPIGTVFIGPMVRIVDLRRSLVARGYGADGELAFACTDGESVRISVSGGVAHAFELQGAGDPESTVRELSSATLASIVTAGVRFSEAAQLGLLRAGAPALRLADQMFAGPRFQCLDPF